MPRIVETTVYELPELSRAAQDRARAWYRDTCLEYCWYDTVFEDFESVCALLGVTPRTHAVRLLGGGTREAPNLWFSGFAFQGSGASFDGMYRYTPGAARAIRAYAPKDETLHAIADDLHHVQRRNFYQLNGVIRQSGRYYHEYSMSIEVERDSPAGQPMTDDAEDTVVRAIRDLARWLYRQLEREYDHLTSDSVVDETIVANSYTFTEAGERFG
ncbi:MAG: antitoxin of toxin-antitoxin stability system [Rhodospirillaceae bacterium]|nr:antitoxin of toxin-antitoxin stability system [Rhodospirillaceae bacterium]